MPGRGGEEGGEEGVGEGGEEGVREGMGRGLGWKQGKSPCPSWPQRPQPQE
jgi:hypothetical protein